MSCDFVANLNISRKYVYFFLPFHRVTRLCCDWLRGTACVSRLRSASTSSISRRPISIRYWENYNLSRNLASSSCSVAKLAPPNWWQPQNELPLNTLNPSFGSDATDGPVGMSSLLVNPPGNSLYWCVDSFIRFICRTWWCDANWIQFDCLRLRDDRWRRHYCPAFGSPFGRLRHLLQIFTSGYQHPESLVLRVLARFLQASFHLNTVTDMLLIGRL